MEKQNILNLSKRKWENMGRGETEQLKQTETNSKMEDLNSAEYVVKLNKNDLHISIKKHSLSNWIKMQDPSMCFPWETHLKGINRLKVKGWKMI